MDACASSPDCYISYDWNDRLKYSFIIHLFGLLWANQFIVGFASVVVAGAVGSYYWARGKGGRCAAGECDWRLLSPMEWVLAGWLSVQSGVVSLLRSPQKTRLGD
jgi:hypothetical protein